MALDIFEWENGTLVEPAKVEIGGVSYDVTDAQYEGSTPISASNMNQMQTILNNNITEAVANQYNLITDGNAVKTGRQIDGKDEYIKRISLNNFPDSNQTKTWPSGISTTNLILVDLNITVKSGSNNWFILPNNDSVDSRVQFNSTGDVSVTMYRGNLTGNNGYANITYYYTS